MTESELQPDSNVVVRGTHWWSRLKRLTSKELRETLRDRRTIITLIMMPLLVYPILSLVFRTILMSTLEDTLGGKNPVVLDIAYESNRDPRQTAQFIKDLTRRIDSGDQESAADLDARPAKKGDPTAPRGTQPNAVGQTDHGLPKTKPGTELGDLGASKGPRFAPFADHHWFTEELEAGQTPDLQQVVLTRDVDLGVKIDFPADNAPRGVNITIVRRGSQRSAKAAEYLETRLRGVNRSELIQRLRSVGLRSTEPVNLQPVEVAVDPNAPPSTSSLSLAALIPLVLVLMTVTGAVYPAIDLTAGERERGTLETLMAAPIPKVSILVAKFFAVWTVAIFTAVLNLVGMAATVWTFQFEKILLGPGGFSLPVILKIFFLLVLFAAFFSALMLAVTSFARSFKEAQAYLIPVILLSMGPGLLAMNPGLSLAGIFSVTPMVNVLLLGRDVINQDVQIVPALLAIGSTILYALLAIQYAASRFGADDVLYANQGSLGELIARPKKVQTHFSIGAALFGLALLLPINLIAIGALGRLANVLESQYVLWALLMMTFTFLSFFGVPWLIAQARRVELKTGFAARMPRWYFWGPAILLGLFMWPVLATFVDQWYRVTALLEGADAAQTRHEQLIELTQGQVEKFRQLPVWVVALAFSIVPALSEEWFFRGMIMQTLLKKGSAWRAILISAALFGFFHVLSNSAVSMDRLLPTTLMGVLLGYVCYRSGSIWPGVVLHLLHNGCLVFLGYFQPQLSQLSWFPQEGADIPLAWVVPAAIVSVIAVVMLAMLKSPVDSPVDR